MQAIPSYSEPVPRLTTAQMIEVDRLMIKTYRIELIQMMENAGRGLAFLAARRFFPAGLAGCRIIVLAGKGGNGGGALVAARRLHNWGARVSVYLSDIPEQLAPAPSHQHVIVRRMGLEIHSGAAPEADIPADLVLDGIIGYSVQGDPYGVPRAMIEWANGQAAPVLALDTPSGLDVTTGTPHTPTIQATATLTLALPKQGLFGTAARKQRGELYLGDISVPAKLYAELNPEIKVRQDLFARGDVVRLE